jgi:DNA adenine methylase
LSTKSPTRPVLRYHGGKWKLAPWLISLFPAHRVYVEPFAGGASVLMRKERSYAEVYNDMDGEIVNVFRVLRDPQSAARLEELVRLTPFARSEFEESYETHPDPVEQARRTILRSFMGFGSAAATGFGTGFRSNSNRSGTTPAHDWTNIPARIAEWTERLRGVVIENKPAVEVMVQHDTEQTLHYVDPPYVLSTRKLGNPYCGKGYRFEMQDDQHRELANVLRSLKGMVILSGYGCELYDGELYHDWPRLQREHLADGAKKRTEVVWMNQEATNRARTLFTEIQ